MLLTLIKEVKALRKEVKTIINICEHTSRIIESKASTVLRDRRYSKTSKSVAGSALSQRQKHK